jgi:hypothetical protein
MYIMQRKRLRLKSRMTAMIHCDTMYMMLQKNLRLKSAMTAQTHGEATQNNGALARCMSRSGSDDGKEECTRCCIRSEKIKRKERRRLSPLAREIEIDRERERVAAEQRHVDTLHVSQRM